MNVGVLQQGQRLIGERSGIWCWQSVNGCDVGQKFLFYFLLALLVVAIISLFFNKEIK